MGTRVDLHVHSKYSDRPSEWLLRRIGTPECFTEPRVVYDTARRRGMSFVTITDHNSIRGAQDIAHLPGVFIGDEITTYFPEDGCKVHVLAWNLTEKTFEEIQRLRENIYELRDYLVREKVPHSCAHPLYSINDRLSLSHFEKLILLFNVFETMNGGRNRRGNQLMCSILDSLTRESFEEMADHYNVAPHGEAPWRKGFTGGSDDHSGAFIAKGFTECPDSESVSDFLGHVLQRRSRSGGLDGTPLSFAHSLYSIGYQYYRSKFLRESGNNRDMVLKTMSEVFGPGPTRYRLRDRVSLYAGKLARRSDKPAEAEFKRAVSDRMTKLFGEDWLKDDYALDAQRYEELNQQTFQLACSLSNELFFQFTRKFVKRLSKGSIFGSIEALSALGPVLLGVSPYLFSFAHQSRDKQFLTDVGRRFLGLRPELDQKPKKAWFTDTLTEINGVTTLVQKMCQLADRHQHDLTLVSLAKRAPALPLRMKNFEPVGEFPLPENESITMAFPPFLDILEYSEREAFTEFIVSTPGLAGLAAVAAARLLNVRMIGIYHTDLPQYIRYYTDDDVLESAAWKYLRWFYEQMDVIYVPSRFYRQQLIDKDFTPRKLRLFPHGTDAEFFHPGRRNPGFWEKYGGNGGAKVLYVGRVAREKDLDVLIEVYDQLARRRPECTLAVVGDGPYLPLMRERLQHANVVFTGFLVGEELSQAYASSDIFIFPSTTDTFGNVVLEAMASGLPVVVSDKGGPKEFVQHGRTGLVTQARNPERLLLAVETLIDNPTLRSQMARNGRSFAENRSWEQIYLNFWQGEEVVEREATGATTS
ncbi:MAG: glycosyltransferase [Acidobacteriota bacterium]